MWVRWSSPDHIVEANEMIEVDKGIKRGYDAANHFVDINQMVEAVNRGHSFPCLSHQGRNNERSLRLLVIEFDGGSTQDSANLLHQRRVKCPESGVSALGLLARP